MINRDILIRVLEELVEFTELDIEGKLCAPISDEETKPSLFTRTIFKDNNSSSASEYRAQYPKAYNLLSNASYLNEVKHALNCIKTMELLSDEET